MEEQYSTFFRGREPDIIKQGRHNLTISCLMRAQLLINRWPLRNTVQKYAE